MMSDRLSSKLSVALITIAVLAIGDARALEAQVLDSSLVKEYARERFQEIEHNLRLDRVDIPHPDGILAGLFDNEGQLRKILFRPAGSDRLVSSEIYFDAGEPFFVFERRSTSGGGVEEHRFYFMDQQLARWLAPGSRAIDITSDAARHEGEQVRAAVAALQADIQPELTRMSGSNGPDAPVLTPTGSPIGQDGPASAVQTAEWIGFALTVFIAFLIVSLFLLFLWQYLRPLHAAAKAMVSARSCVPKPEQSFDEGETDAKREKRYAEEAGSLFPKPNARLRQLWVDFRELRHETTRPHQSKRISTVDPGEVFYDEAVFGTYNRNFAITLAGFFTGLGILGTFAGLVLGLYRIDASSERMLDSIGSLLAGMSTAFYTSLIGIFFSLLWLILDRVLYDRVQKATDAFLQEVRVKYPVEGADRLLHHLLDVEQSENQAIHESRDLLAEQKGILQSLSVDIAVAFEEAMTASLDKALTPQFQKMTEVLEALSVQIGDRQVEALDKMVETFQDRLSAELRGNLEGLAQSMATAAEWQEQVHADLGQLCDRLRAAADRQADLVESTNAAASVFGNSLSALASAHEHIVQSLGSLETATGDLQTVAGIIGTQAEVLEGRIDVLGQENKVYREANESIRLQLAQQIESLDSRMSDLDELWQSLGEQLEEAGGRLQASANEFSNLTTQKLQEIFARFDSEMATVVQHLAGTLAEIREVTDGLPGNVAALGDHLSGHVGALEGTTTAVKEAGQRLQAVENLGAALTRLEPLQDAMARVAFGMARTTDQLTQLTGRIQSVDGNVAEFVRQVVKANGDARDPTPAPASPAPVES
jgi:hypothetical protein